MCLDSQLLEILACPACKANVVCEGEKLLCVQCGRRYPVEEGIPIMLLDRAEPPSSEGRPQKGGE